MLRPKNICQTTDLLILGGGLTGLCAAYYLRRHLSCILLEKSNRTGGVIQSQRINNFLVELGPDCFMNQKPWAYVLAKELGLENEIIKAEPSHQQVWVLKNGSFEISDYQDPSVTEFLGSRALATPSTPYSFQNGMQTLTDKLSDRVDNFVLKNTYATHVNWDKLLVTCNSGIQIQAKSILIALPAWEAAKLLGFEIPFKTTQSHCVYLAYDHAAFSKPFDVWKKFGLEWIAREDDLDEIAEYLDRVKHFPFVSEKNKKLIRKAGKTEIKGAIVSEWNKKGKRV